MCQEGRQNDRQTGGREHRQDTAVPGQVSDGRGPVKTGLEEAGGACWGDAAVLRELGI